MDSSLYSEKFDRIITLLEDIKKLLIVRSAVKVEEKKVSNLPAIFDAYNMDAISKGVVGIAEFLVKKAGLQVEIVNSEKLIFEYKPKGSQAAMVKDTQGMSMLYKFRDQMKEKINQVIQSITDKPSSNPTMTAINNTKIKYCQSVIDFLEQPNPEKLGKEILNQVR